MKRCDLLVCCMENILGILKFMVQWKQDWVAFKDLLRRLGWSMMEVAIMGSNSVQIPNNYYTDEYPTMELQGCPECRFQKEDP